MRTTTIGRAWAMVGLMMAVGQTACGEGPSCASDLDCKGDRICQAGACVDPSSAGGGSSTGAGGSNGGNGSGAAGANPTCTDACTPGDKRCSNDAVQPCQQGPDGCFAWAAGQPCSSGCDPSTVQCIGAVCGNHQIEDGEACEDSDFDTATCATMGHDGGTLQCTGCQISTSGCCDDACQAGVTQCVGDGVKTCAKAGSDCAAWSDVQPCPYGCAGGACLGDPCAGVSCTSPGSCQFNGTCNNGECSYNNKPANTTCDDGDPQTQNDKCDGAGTCSGCNVSYAVDWVCNQYNMAVGDAYEIFNICGSLDPNGKITLKATKFDGSTFGSRPYHVEVSSPADGSCGPSNWFFQDVQAPAQGIGTPTLTFSFTPNWQQDQTQKAYCVVASTKSGDIGYNAGDMSQTSWWHSKKIVLTKTCQ